MMINEEFERVISLDESEMNTSILEAYRKGSKTNGKIYTHEWVVTILYYYLIPKLHNPTYSI